MTHEKLKVIAEGMGYEVVSNENGGMIASKAALVVGYNPLTNAGQCMEIMHKTKIYAYYSEASELWHSHCLGKSGKTINEAVCNAAYEYFNETS